MNKKIPKVEIIRNNKRMSLPDYLINICKEDLPGLDINLNGYDEILERLQNLDYKSPEESWKLSLEANAWLEYLTNLKNLLYMVLQDMETNKIATIAEVSIEHEPDKPTKGNRLANKDPLVVKIRKKRNHIETLYNLIVDKMDVLEKTHYFCKTTCEWNYRMLEARSRGNFKQ